ncbi:MAG: lysophospholipid acyltransferase family protein [Candidatus Omnitrophota bacterium]
MIHTVSRFICFLISKFFFRISWQGRENIPKRGGFIIASNHVSFLDPVMVGVACPRKLNYMARHDLFSNRFFSCWLYNVGAFPVKRKTADISALKEAIKRLEDGKGLILFPEGARVENITLNKRPEPGVGFLASKVNVPVIAAFVKGAEKAFPRGANFFRPEKVSVYFGKQIRIDTKIPYQDIADIIMADIRQLAKNSS